MNDPQPLTDEELDRAAALTSKWMAFYARSPNADRGGRLYGMEIVDPEIAGRLVAEVRRLRRQLDDECVDH